MIQYRDFDAVQLEQFWQLQRRAYATLEDIATTLRAGESERDVTPRIRRAMAGRELVRRVSSGFKLTRVQTAIGEEAVIRVCARLRLSDRQ